MRQTFSLPFARFPIPRAVPWASMQQTFGLPRLSRPIPPALRLVGIHLPMGFYCSTLYFGRMIHISQKARSAEISIAVGAAKQAHGMTTKITQNRVAVTPSQESATTTRLGFLRIYNQWLAPLAIMVSALRAFSPNWASE